MNFIIDTINIQKDIKDKNETKEFYDVDNQEEDFRSSDTMELIKECVLCKKEVLGIVALGRHMKKEHVAYCALA